MPEYITKVNVSGVTYDLPSPSTVAWTAGTTAGPTGTLTMNNGDTVQIDGIPSASKTGSGVITSSGTQEIGGIKKFGLMYLCARGSSNASTRWPGDIVLESNDGTKVGEFFYDQGATNTISTGMYHIRQFSPNSTASTTTMLSGELLQ